MSLLGFRREWTALAVCKSIKSSIQWFQIHHGITFATIQDPAVYLSGARVSSFSTLVPGLMNKSRIFSAAIMSFNAIRENKILAKISGFTVIQNSFLLVGQSEDWFAARDLRKSMQF